MGPGAIDPSSASSGTTITITGVSEGAAQVIARVERGGVIECEATKNITVTNPKVNVGVRACNAPNMLTCDDCDEPVGFTGTFSLHSFTNPETTQTKQVSGSSLVTFSDVSGGSIPSNLTLTASDTSAWTVLGPATHSYPTGSWPTAGETYGPHDHCVTSTQPMGSRV